MVRAGRAWAVFAGMVVATWAQPALAAPEEIQVYQDEIGPRGKVGLDVHLSDVFTGEGGADYPGGEPSLHRIRITPEFSLGLGSGFEAGLYLPLATIAGDGTLRAQGIKTRLKWIAPHNPDRGFYWGGNFEIGRVAYRLDQNPWNAEFKGIAGWRGGRWSLAANANVDFTVSGPAPGPATLELATKVEYAVTPTLALGVENFNEIGPFRRLGFLGENAHTSLGTVSTRLGGFDFAFGLGAGYGTNGDHLLTRLIVGVPL